MYHVFLILISPNLSNTNEISFFSRHVTLHTLSISAPQISISFTQSFFLSLSLSLTHPPPSPPFMASLPSGLANGASNGFHFTSGDILCSYEDNNTNDCSSNGIYIDPAKVTQRYPWRFSLLTLRFSPFKGKFLIWVCTNG